MHNTQESVPPLALVLSGGGARGAYEAGVLAYIRSALPEPIRHTAFDIVTGASVGAINAAFLASSADQPAQQGIRLSRLWRALKEDQIYRRDTKALMHFVNKFTSDLVKHLIWGVDKSHSHFKGFLDASPLLPFLKETIEWSQIQRNIRHGHIKALAIVATNIASGNCELFLNHHPSIQYSGDYCFYANRIQAYHVLASASIPFVFPPMMINGMTFTDGGLSLNTPISPAIQLGAEKILAISLHSSHLEDKALTCPMPAPGNAPVTGQLLGRIMGSLFENRMDSDIDQIHRINRIIEWGACEFGSDFLARINQMLHRNAIVGDIADRGLKHINIHKMQPSRDLSGLFIECFNETPKKSYTLFEKMLMRSFDMDSVSGAEFLSYLMFNKLYIHKLIELGFADAQAQADTLIDFFVN